MVRGNLTPTDIRKKSIPQSSIPGLGSKTVIMHHEATEGDTSIDLTNLTPVQDYIDQGIANPTVAEIQVMNLGYNSKGLRILSSLNGELMRLHYKMSSATLIQLIDYEASTNEVFEIRFEPSIIGGSTVVDARPLVYTGVLAEGATEVTLSDVWEYNKFPLYQIGAIMVYRGSGATLQLRNTGNATAGPSADGNYQEIPAFGNSTNTIKFNVPGAVGGEVIIAMSVGALTERPTQSQISFIESLQGAQNKIIEVLAATSGQPESYFGGQPTTVDLAVFGERFQNLLDLTIPDISLDTDWASFTPVLLNGDGLTPTYVYAMWRRNGPDMLVMLHMSTTTVGTNSSSNFGFTLPNSKLINTAIFKTGVNNHCGSGSFYDTTTYDALMVWPVNTAALGIKSQPRSFIRSSEIPVGAQISIEARVPIVGWSGTPTSQTIRSLLGL